MTSDWLLGLSDERGGGVSVTATGGSAVASQSPGARVAASATSAEVERLRGEVAALERALRMFAGGIAPRNAGTQQGLAGQAPVC